MCYTIITKVKPHKNTNKQEESKMREATWINMGTDVRGMTDVNEILTKANLDYNVVKQDIQLPNGFVIPKKKATIKEGTNEYIGVVSDTYEIYQNQDAFGFINEIPNVTFEKAGETSRGLVYIIGKLPETQILGDTFNPYIIFQTSHNGLYNVRATICPLRFVCQNQFAVSFKKMRNTVDIRHSRRLPTKIAQAHTLLTETAAYMESFNDTAEELAAIKVTNMDTVHQILDKFFDKVKEDRELRKQKEATERQMKRIEAQKEFFIDCYRSEDNSNFRGTVWGLVNAFTDYTTHRQRKKTLTANEGAFMEATFDSVNTNNFLEVVREFV